jgi:hypothetical protein
MILQEEYLKRHRIALPQVHHTLRSGSVIFKIDPESSDLQDRWAIVSLRWRDNPHHPGHYEVNVRHPRHNGCIDGNLFDHARGYPPDLTLQYEELEKFFLDFATAHGKIQTVTDRKESTLLGWEIFLYCYDDFLAKSASSVFFSQIEGSIDSDLSISERHCHYNSAVNTLMTNFRGVFDIYGAQIHTHTQNNLTWLANLVNGV